MLSATAPFLQLTQPTEGDIMVTCRDVNNLDLDGVELLTGEVGLDRVVSWTYFVQTKPYESWQLRTDCSGLSAV